jgi:hypothetical protein
MELIKSIKIKRWHGGRLFILEEKLKCKTLKMDSPDVNGR